MILALAAYQAILWSTGATPADTGRWFERLREMGFTAEQLTAGRSASPFLQHNFGYYVENLVPELAFLHSRQALYDADWKAYTATRDKAHLVRKPCFHDEDFWAAAETRLRNLVRPYAGQRPLFYDLRDELSLGSYASPMDYCFGSHTLRAFRQWLRESYGDLEALNREWESGFASWDEVVPFTTYEIKDRERAGSENYAPWADHRAFMDLTFARALARMRSIIREVDPDTPVGIEGTQMPSAWGGYDLWRLSQAVDWVEPYDIGGSYEIFRSFLPAGAPILSTVFGDDFNAIRRKLWWRLLHGDSGAIVWDDENSRTVAKDEPDLPLTGRGRGLGEVLREIRAAAPRFLGNRRLDDRIAIHYSQASIRAHWMFDSRADRDTWPRRFSSFEAVWSRLARVRDGFLRVLEDLGLQYNFVSYEQIENGELSRYRVLILPQSVALSAREAERMREFVRGGGLLIADHMTATMNEHCRRLAEGQLDELFGIRRHSTAWRARPAGGRLDTGEEVCEPDIEVVSGEALTSDAGVPAVVVNAHGDGRAVYLNLNLHDYGKLRLEPPKAEPLLRRFESILGVARVTDTAGVEVFRYQDGTLALMRNPEFNIEALGRAGYPSQAELEKPARVRVHLPEGRVEEVDLDPWRPTILAARSSDAEVIEAQPR